MTRKTRTILFFICLILFLLIAPSVIFYSQGYRVDFDRLKIVQTGAFSFKVWPKRVEIYLDGELKKKTDFLFGTALIENLLPKKYNIEIKKEGFWPWKKTLEIKEKEVTEAKNIVLIPQNPKFVILASNQKEIDDILYKVKAEREKNKIEKPAILLNETLNTTSSYRVLGENVFWLSEEQNFYRKKLQEKNQKELIAQNIKNFEISPDSQKIALANNYEIWVLFLKPQLSQPQKSAPELMFLTRFSEKIGKIFWYTSHYLIFNVGEKIKIAEIDDRDRINIYNIAKFKNPEIFWTPPTHLYILSEGNLYLAENLIE